ncbi:hypothetical protein [Bacillus safensis]|nr:hypothetical protein [Bacillus safensis]
MNKNWSRNKLEELITNELKQFSISKTKKQKKKRSINYEKLIKELDKKVSRLIALYASDTKISLDLIEKQIDELNLEKDRLIKKQEHLLLEDSKFITDDMLKDIQYDFEELDFKSKQIIIQNFISEIHIDGDDVIIDWRF